MRSRNKTSHCDLLLTLHQRVQKMGLQRHPRVRFLFKLCRSPMQDVAFQYTHELEQLLDRMEFNNALYGNESVPALPPDTSIEIGKTVRRKQPFRVSTKTVLHWLVYGASGFGKTTLLGVVERAVRGLFSCTLIDHKDEGRRFINNVPNSVYLPLDKQRWNLLKGVGDQADYIRYISDQLARFMSLHPVTSNAVRARLLSLCQDKTALPSLSDFAKIFLQLAQKELRSSLNTASRGFDDLAAAFGRWADVRQGEWPFIHPLNVVPLKDLPPVIEHFYVSLLLKQMTDRASAQGHSAEQRHMIFFDEALSYMGKEMEPTTGSGRVNQVAEMMRICRSYGISILAATQSLSGIQDSVIDNASVFIAFKANHPQEAKLVCRRLGFDENRHPEIMNLEAGTAFALTPDCHQPVKIKVPFLDLGIYPSEPEIARQMEPVWTAWDERTVFAPAKNNSATHIDFRELLGETAPDPEPAAEATKTTQTEPNQEPKPYIRKPSDPVIISEYLAMLRSCEAHPNFGATTHYKSLGWSMGRGNRVKARLVELGWVEAVSIIPPKGGRPKVTLQLTETGRGVLDEPA